MRRLLQVSGLAVATVLGSGYAPIAPGTVSSLVSAAAFLLVVELTGWGVLPLILVVPITVVCYLGCVAGYREWGGDPSRVTADEFAGCWIACLALPSRWGIAGIAAAFLLFRLFDIAKPWPVSRMDRIQGPAGILLDDVAAGIFAMAVLLTGRLLHVPA